MQKINFDLAVTCKFLKAKYCVFSLADPFNHILDKHIHGKNVPEPLLHVCLFFSEEMKSSMKS